MKINRKEVVLRGWVIVVGVLAEWGTISDNESDAWEKLAVRGESLSRWDFFKRLTSHDTYTKHLKPHVLGGMIVSLKAQGYRAIRFEMTEARND